MSDLNGNGVHAPMPGGYETVMSQGTEWRLSWINPGIRKAFTHFAIMRAKERLADDPKDMNWLRSRIAAGAYDWGTRLDESGMGDDLQASMNAGEGGTKLFMLLLEANHGPVSLQQLGLIFEGHEEDFKQALIRCIDPNQRTPKESGDLMTKRDRAALLNPEEVRALQMPISSPSLTPQD